MHKYLIEVPHEDTKAECDRAIKTFLTTGSHFLTNADWGCKDGEHKAWFIAETESKEDAKMIVPPGYRERAKIVQLAQFSVDDVGKIYIVHQD